jgi:hypothetical protein
MMNRQLTRRLLAIEEKLGRTSYDKYSAIRSQLLSQVSDADLDLLEQTLTLIESGQETVLSNEQRGALDNWNKICSEACA